ncbi:MAG: peptidylprolyl isomerase [Rubritalea sp.]
MKSLTDYKIKIRLSLLAFIASLNISSAVQTRVQLETNYGDLYLTLYDDDAPLTVANFLSYITSDAFDDTFFHRSVPSFVLQGGGFEINSGTISSVVTTGTVDNEFGISNTRGTIAMAQSGSDPDSATSGWFINLVDNDGTTANNLDTLNGGFTVFGFIENMSLVDLIMAETFVADITSLISGPFEEVPLDNSVLDDSEVSPGDFVIIQNASVIPEPSSSALLLLGVGSCLLIRRRK